MKPLTRTIDIPPPDWPFIHYDPTTEPPLPQPEPRPTLTARLITFGVTWICRTTACVVATLAVYVLATGQL